MDDEELKKMILDLMSGSDVVTVSKLGSTMAEKMGMMVAELPECKTNGILNGTFLNVLIDSCNKAIMAALMSGVMGDAIQDNRLGDFQKKARLFIFEKIQNCIVDAKRELEEMVAKETYSKHKEPRKVDPVIENLFKKRT